MTIIHKYTEINKPLKTLPRKFIYHSPPEIVSSSFYHTTAPVKKMTRKSWTTEAQLAWLQERQTAFLEALQKKMLSSEFYPKTLQAFCEIWPVDPATNEEIASAMSAETANKVKRDKYDRVRSSFTIKEKCLLLVLRSV
jgi:hypothetical protein